MRKSNKATTQSEETDETGEEKEKEREQAEGIPLKACFKGAIQLEVKARMAKSNHRR
jgi:hypothetical protein